MKTLASSIAIALENARLYECIRRDEQRLANDLKQARDIQSGLLPDEVTVSLDGGPAQAMAEANLADSDTRDGKPYVWQTSGLVAGDAWSDYLEGSKDLVGDWTDPINCGNYNAKTKKCSGQNY